MKSDLTGAKSDLTVLVFKNNSTARTFRVSTRWISRLGLLVGATAAVACLGTFLSLKYYLAARQAIRNSDPSYVQDLEAEVASLRAAGKSIPTQAQPAPAVTTATSMSNTSTATGQAQPVPTVTVTVTAPPSQTAIAPGSSLAFSALPASVAALGASDVPIDIYEPRVNWSGRTLKVQFFIQYAREDKGNQQGRIVLLARGPDTLLAYPAGVLNTEANDSLVAPDKGEYFSVSRIREVKADFGPMKSRTALKEVEIFLFSAEGKLLIHQILSPTVTEAAPESAPAAPSSDKDSSPSNEPEQ